MPGNSRRRGSVARRSKPGPPAGSGGRGRRALAGRGPTPKAEDREGHPAQRRAERKRTPAARGRATAGEPADWVLGRNAVLAALQAGVPVRRIYVADGSGRDPRLDAALDLVATQQMAVDRVPRPQLDRLTGVTTHQGIAVQAAPFAYAHPDDVLDQAERRPGGPPLLVALDGVVDPRNLGAVVRCAAGFGADGVVVPKRRAAGMTAAGWKASAGAAATVPVARATNLARQLRAYRQRGLTVVGLDQAGRDIAALGLGAGPLVLVAGEEGRGLSRLVQETCDLTARVPTAPSMNSLNVAVATGIALYVVTRGRAGGAVTAPA